MINLKKRHQIENQINLMRKRGQKRRKRGKRRTKKRKKKKKKKRGHLEVEDKVGKVGS